MVLATSGSHYPAFPIFKHLATHWRIVRSFLILGKCLCHMCFKLSGAVYLPKGPSIPLAGSHLNIVLPLWQGFSTQSGEVVTRQTFIGVIHSSDSSSWMGSVLEKLLQFPLTFFWPPALWILGSTDGRYRELGYIARNRRCTAGQKKKKRERFRELQDFGGTIKVY